MEPKFRKLEIEGFEFIAHVDGNDFWAKLYRSNRLSIKRVYETHGQRRVSGLSINLQCEGDRFDGVEEDIKGAYEEVYGIYLRKADPSVSPNAR